MQADDALRGRVVETGVFDAGYYQAAYREAMDGYAGALEHFLATGLARGFKPNAQFDPLAYRLLFPETGTSNPLLHFLDRPDRAAVLLTAGRALPSVPKAGSYLPVEKFDFVPAQDAQANLRHATRFAEPALCEFPSKGRSFRMEAPAPEMLLGRLVADRPFALARLPHGFWDCLYVHSCYRPDVAEAVSEAGFTPEQVDRMTSRLCDEFYPERGVFVEHFIEEIAGDLRNPPRDARFMRAVCFKGYPTADERIFYRSKTLKASDRQRLDILADYFDPAERLLDATVWKRWLISGALRDLPDRVRSRPVILLSAAPLKSLGERWRLPYFLHVEMAAALSQKRRFAILDNCKEKILEAEAVARRRATPRPVFLLQGGSFAYWLIVRLFSFRPDIFYIDLGQALHAWFYDLPEIPLMPWGKLYARTIIENCRLGDYYRRRGAPLPESL